MNRVSQRKLHLFAALLTGTTMALALALAVLAWTGSAGRALASNDGTGLAAASTPPAAGQAGLAPAGKPSRTPKTPSPTPSPLPSWTPHAPPPAATTPAPTAAPPSPAQTIEPNSLTNGTFDDTSCLTGWSASSSVTCTSVAGHGSQVAQVLGGASMTSNVFPVSADAFVDVTAWFNWQSVSGLDMHLYAYNSNNSQIQGWQMFGASGTCPDCWKKVGWFVLAPAGTHHMQVRISNGSGTAYVDDVYVRVVNVPVDKNAVQSPAIVPQPWQMKTGSPASLPLATTTIIYPEHDDRLLAAADSYWTSLGIDHTMVPDSQIPSTISSPVVVRFGAPSVPEIANALATAFPGSSTDQLGNEGYFLRVGQPAAGQVRIYAGANEENGLFYALSSIKQIIKGGSIYTVDVLDVNTVARRGMIMGEARFSQYPADLDTMAGYKMNYIWNQGQLLNNKFNYNWRTAFTADEMAQIRNYLIAADQHFVIPWMSIGPRATQNGRNSTCYSCATDIQLVVDKMTVLWDLGLRHFGLNFDDLWNVGQDSLYWSADKSMFSNIGEAHAYFANQVYVGLLGKHSEISDPKVGGFMLLPMYCYAVGDYGAVGKGYLTSLVGSRYPLDSRIGINSVNYYDADYLSMKAWTGRGAMTWSNFYAEGHQASGTYAVPHIVLWDWWNANVNAAMTGLSFLAPDVPNEDAAKTSWTTTADYFWAPDRYDPQRSFQLGAAKYAGK